MRNQYQGACYRCGEIVEPGAGFFERIGRDQRKKWPGITGRWHVQHDTCAKLWQGTSRHYRFNPIAEDQP